MEMGKILAGIMNSFGLETNDGSCVSWFTATSPISISAVTRHITASFIIVSVFAQQIYVFSESSAFNPSETTEIVEVICVLQRELDIGHSCFSSIALYWWSVIDFSFRQNVLYDGVTTSETAMLRTREVMMTIFNDTSLWGIVSHNWIYRLIIIK